MRNCSSLPANSLPRKLAPVTLPPGLTKPGTIPSSTGFATPTITMGIDLVACMRTRAAGTVWTRIKSGASATSSLANEGRRALSPPVIRGSSKRMFRPSVQPSFSSSGRRKLRKTSMSARGKAGEKTDTAHCCLTLGRRVGGQPDQGERVRGNEGIHRLWRRR